MLTVNVAKPMKPTSFNKPGALCCSPRPRTRGGCARPRRQHDAPDPVSPVWAEADEWWKKTLEERGTDFETNEASDADMVPRGATE